MYLEVDMKSDVSGGGYKVSQFDFLSFIQNISYGGFRR